MASQYNWEQKVLSLIWLSYCISIPHIYVGDREDLEELATESITTVLAEPSIQKLIGQWQLTWGPAIYQLEGRVLSSNVNDNTMFVVKSAESSEVDKYVISIAGTNPYSLYDHLVGNLHLEKTRGWNNGKPWESPKKTANDDEPAISTKTSNGLRNLMTKMWHGDKLLLEHLKELTSKAKKPIAITVAGHSLGGALSSTLALALVDRQAEWDEKNIATVDVVSVAAPSPGNGAFANLTYEKFGDKAKRIWNQLDIVALAWEAESVQRFPSIYAPNTPSTKVMELVFGKIQPISDRQNYQQIDKSVEGFPSSFNQSFEVANVKNNQELRNHVLNQGSQLLAYGILCQLQAVPYLAEIFEGRFKVLVTEFAASIRECLDRLITVGGDIEPALKEKLNNFLDVFGGESLDLFNLPFDIELDKYFDAQCLSSNQVLNLMNYTLQVLYQHVQKYVEYFNFGQFDQKRHEITDQVAEDFQEEDDDDSEIEVDDRQIEAEKKAEKAEKYKDAKPVIIDYGDAKSKDIRDLYRAEGKIYSRLSGAIKQLKKSGNISKNAQPVVLIVKKKKRSKRSRRLLDF